MKRTLLLGLLSLLGLVCCNSSDATIPGITAKKNYSEAHAEAKSYCVANGFNTDYYFLVDLSVHSGKNRFFVYDFMHKKVTDQKLVTHGSCDVPVSHPDRWQKARFSNTNDSHCSALGKYKIGARDKSGWGIKIKYWLQGLEKTNELSKKSVIVLHSWEAV